MSKSMSEHFAETDAIAEWLGAMPEARNVFDITDEATTVLTIDVEVLAELIAQRMGAQQERLRTNFWREADPSASGTWRDACDLLDRVLRASPTATQEATP